MGTLSGTHMHLYDTFLFRGRTMFSHRPHFVGLNGLPLGAPIWVPYRAPISRFHFVKLLPLRGRHAGLSMQAYRHAGAHISLGSTSLNYCPFGAGIYVWGYPFGVGIQAYRYAAHTYFDRFHLLISFSFTGSFGPSNAPFGCIWVPYRAPIGKNNS